MTTRTRVSLQEFLALPETQPPSELINGEVIQKMAPNWSHSRLAAVLAYLLESYLRESGEAEVHVEYRHLRDPEERAYLPDLNVTLRGRITVEMRRLPILPIQPDFAIEILSPDDRVSRVIERASFYMRAGIRLLWLVDPDDETITVYRPDRAALPVRAPAMMDAEPVLRNFRLDVAALFATLHEDEDEPGS